MHLVYDNEPQVSEKSGYHRVFPQKHSLQRLRSYLQYPRRMFQHLVLVGLRYISVPVPYRYIRLLAQFIEPYELIVDKCLQRSYIYSSHRTWHILGKQREYGKKCRLSLT